MIKYVKACQRAKENGKIESAVNPLSKNVGERMWQSICALTSKPSGERAISLEKSQLKIH